MQGQNETPCGYTTSSFAVLGRILTLEPASKICRTNHWKVTSTRTAMCDVPTSYACHRQRHHGTRHDIISYAQQLMDTSVLYAQMLWFMSLSCRTVYEEAALTTIVIEGLFESN